MFKNQIKIAFRNLIRQKFYTLLNLTGLSVGLAACSLIVLYIQDELSYDSFHTKQDRIYRIDQTNIWSDYSAYLSATGPNVAQALLQEFPEIESVVRIHTVGTWLVSNENNSEKPIIFEEDNIFGVDSTFFDLFSFEMISGNPKEALKQPNSLVLTQETARRYFGQVNPIGKSLSLEKGDQRQTFQVTGIIKDIPSNSQMQFSMLGSLHSFPGVKQREWSWIWTTFVHYVLLKEGTNVNAFEARLKSLPRKYANPSLKRLFGYDINQFEAESGKKWQMYLLPLRKIYLQASNRGNRLGSGGDIQNIYMFGIVAVLVLALSCINFMNLATARSAHRAKEVGIRKVLGSYRQSLIMQFLLESSVFIFLSAIVGLLICDLFLPYFNQLAQKELNLYSMLQPNFLGALLIIILAMGVLAGAYPAFYLTSFQPRVVLKGKFVSGRQSKIFRNVLVVFQFAISIALIISTLLVYQQLNYVQAKKIGYDKEHLLLIPNVERLSVDIETFKNELAQINGISQTSMANSIPAQAFNQDYFSTSDNPDVDFPLEIMAVDEDYLTTLGLELVAGRNFSKKYATDIQAVILNETAVRELGWNPENALGKSIKYYENQEFKVIGILKDFNFASLQVNIAPCGIFLHDTSSQVYLGTRKNLTLRLDAQAEGGQSLSQLIQKLEEKWAKFAPSVPFNYAFYEDRYNRAFQSEQQVGQVMSIFASLAIFIACLGLYGLASFTIEQRRKEIGIRKVMGARIQDIIRLLSKEYVRLVFIAFVLSAPLAYYLIQQWLQDFPYRTPISSLLFVTVGLGIALLAWSTVAYQSIQAARQNPIDSLRNE